MAWSKYLGNGIWNLTGLCKRLDDDSYIILCLYVDDMLETGSNMDHIKGLKRQLAHAFAMKDLRVEKQILGYEDL